MINFIFELVKKSVKPPPFLLITYASLSVENYRNSDVSLIFFSGVNNGTAVSKFYIFHSSGIKNTYLNFDL